MKARMLEGVKQKAARAKGKISSNRQSVCVLEMQQTVKSRDEYPLGEQMGDPMMDQ